MADAVLRPDVAAFLDLLAARPSPSFAEMGPEQARAAMRAMGAMFDLPARALARDETFSTLDDGGPAIPLRLFDPRPSRAASPVVLFLHGGGFVLGDVAGYAAPCSAIAEMLDLPVVAVDYRLAPEHPWPAAPDDCEAAARFIADRAKLGFAVEGLVLIGDSAGGGLAAVTAMALRDRPAAVPTLALCTLYPVADQRSEHPSYERFAEGHLLRREDMRWFLDAYGADRAHWRASPLAGRLEDLPPTVVATAALDPLRDEGRALAAALASAGVPTAFYEAKGMVHGFLGMRRAMPSAAADLEAAFGLLRALLAMRAAAATPTGNALCTSAHGMRAATP